MSKAAFITDFLGTTFCFVQLQLDSDIAGYSSFFFDPQLNLAKALIAFFSFVNTSIILAQIYCIYAGAKRKKLANLDSTIQDTFPIKYAAQEISTADDEYLAADSICAQSKLLSQTNSSNLQYSSWSDETTLRRQRIGSEWSAP